METIIKSPNSDLKKIASELVNKGHGYEMLNMLADMLMTEQTEKTLYTLYLGLDAQLDGTLENKIADIVSNYTDSFTIAEATGYFKNSPEYTQLVQIGVENHKIAYDCAEELRAAFDQIAVGVVETGEYKRVIRNKINPPS